MTEPGKERECPSCGHRFDLGPERDLNCPKCGTESRPTDDELRSDGGTEQTGTERSPMPASRLAAELSKSSSVRVAKRQFEYRLWVTTTDDGFSRGELRTIREYGWRVSGFDHRRNGVSIVREDRFRVAADGGDRGV